MENINIGVVNAIISNNLNESYFNDQLIEESKKIAFDFLDIVKNSPILQLEFKTYNNIEGKHIVNDLLAKEYVDTHVKLFETYTIEEVEAEHEKLSNFLKEHSISTKINENSDITLYNSINNLVLESLKNGNDVNVDTIHESFTLVFNHIKTPKQQLTESVEEENLNETVIQIAVDNFNKKYANLDEGDTNLIKKLVKSDDKGKETLLETYKTETLELLESYQEKHTKDNLTKAFAKIKEMYYNKETVDDNIIGLHELKRGLL